MPRLKHTKAAPNETKESRNVHKQNVRKGDYMASGKVKWYKKSTGYGFIAPDDGSEELFVHHSLITNENLRVLTPHQKVTFDVKEGPMGPLAVNVRA